MPTGTFTQNTARQSHTASSPPRASPRNCPAKIAAWFTPMAKPRRYFGNASVKIAAEFAVSIEPPSACRNRQPISHIAACEPVKGSSDSRTEAAVNTAKPRLQVLTRPRMSPSRPRLTTSTACTSRYPMIIHSR
jgi:hypothetical protein